MLATKQDLAEAEPRLARRLGGLIIGALVGLTGACAVIVAWVVKS